MAYGKFISIEGIDGAGKSTHLKFIMDYLNTKNVSSEIVSCREPGGTVIGEDIRNVLLNSEYMNPVTEMLLMFASRQELISNVIVPNLEKGNWVVSDRFVDAAFAYQGAGRQLGDVRVRSLYSLLDNPIQTNLTIVFDVSLDVAESRLSKSGVKDRIEKESKEFFLRVQNAYHKLSQDESHRVKIVSTDGSKMDTEKQITNILDNFLEA